MLKHAEQRHYSRMSLNTRMTLANRQKSIVGLCLNLSAEGALLEVPNGECQVGEQWQLVVPSASEKVPPLKATATILRVDSTSTMDQVAVSLTEVR